MVAFATGRKNSSSGTGRLQSKTNAELVIMACAHSSDVLGSQTVFSGDATCTKHDLSLHTIRPSAIASGPPARPANCVLNTVRADGQQIC